jgi:hypothetical protein
LAATSFVSAGQIVSNAGDLTRFFAALLGGRLLALAQLEAMKTEVVPYGYGLGLRMPRQGVRARRRLSGLPQHRVDDREPTAGRLDHGQHRRDARVVEAAASRRQSGALLGLTDAPRWAPARKRERARAQEKSQHSRPAARRLLPPDPYTASAAPHANQHQARTGGGRPAAPAGFQAHPGRCTEGAAPTIEQGFEWADDFRRGEWTGFVNGQLDEGLALHGPAVGWVQVSARHMLPQTFHALYVVEEGAIPALNLHADKHGVRVTPARRSPGR